MAFIRAFMNGIVLLFNLIVTGSIIAFTAFAAGTTLFIDETNTDVEIFVPAPIEVDKRVDMEYFLIDPHEYEQEFCLAQNVYFEASIDNKAGMAGVADVVLNRVKDKRYPNTICEVVYQAVMKESWKTRQYPDLPDKDRVYYPKRNMCQFSW